MALQNSIFAEKTFLDPGYVVNVKSRIRGAKCIWVTSEKSEDGTWDILSPLM